MYFVDIEGSAAPKVGFPGVQNRSRGAAQKKQIDQAIAKDAGLHS